MTDIDELIELKYLLGSIIRGYEKDAVMQVPRLHALVIQLDLNPELEDEDCNLLLSIDSDLREFPLEPGFRSRCHPEFLERMDSGLLELKQLCEKSVVEACERLYERMEKQGSQS